MQRALPLLALLLLIGGGAYFLLSGDAPAQLEDYDDGDGALDGEDEEHVLLEGDSNAAARIEADRLARERAKAEDKERERALAATQPKVFLEGRVVDARTNQPVKGAYAWLESAEQPCPRLPGRGAFREVRRPGTDVVQHEFSSPQGPRPLGAGPPPPRTPHATERTDADGRFSMAARGDIDHALLRGGFDLFVMADGFVATVVCALPNGKDVEVRLERGHTIRGTVRNVFNRPVPQARVQAKPADGTPQQLGHFAWTLTDEQGRFELTGLVSGAVNVTVEHPQHMAKTVGPREPNAPGALDIQLVSAFFVKFALETANGQPPKNTTIEWRTSGKPPHAGLALLFMGTEPSEDRSYEGRAPAMPCDHREVVFTLKAEGHATWTSDPILLPQEGGEKTVPVVLQADTSRARVRVHFEKVGGEAVSYVQLGAQERIIVRGPQEVAGGLVKHMAADFELSGVPPGPYRLIFEMPSYAPVQLDFTAREGEEIAETITLQDPAKLRVRFTASEALVVTFRITKDEQVVPVFIEGEKPTNEPVDPNEAGARRIEASVDGTVLTGLGNGVHVIDVVDPKLRAARTRVTLVEGDEVEVEIAVSRR